jgi:hypothetical protein
MLLAVFVVVSTLVTPQPKSQPHSQTPPARTLPSPGIAPQPSTPPPLCQTPGEVPPDGSVCGCPWGVGPGNQCLCPPEGPTPPPCTGALRPPLPKPDEALAARSNGLPEQWNSDVAVPGSRSPALRRLRKIQMLTDQPAGILRVDLQNLPDQRT